jgi:hypothetical protein
MKYRTLIGVVLGLNCLGCYRQTVIARYWKTEAEPNAPRVFPEQADESPTSIRLKRHTESIGVCFSGGGIRSASATVGQLHGLKEIGLLSKVDYIACASGGSWAATPFVFSDLDSDALLGSYEDATALKLNDLDDANNGKIVEAIQKINTPTWVEILFRSLISVGFRDNQFFAKVLSSSLLQPVGLNCDHKFVTQDIPTRQRILDVNPQLTKDDFVIPAKDKPFLIVTGTIRRYDLLPWNWSRSYNKRLPIEMTPLYVGLPHAFHDVGEEGNSVGGNYVQPLAYGATKVAANEKTVYAELTNDPLGIESERFGLADMIAISGAAPAEYSLVAHVAFPYFTSWSSDNPPQTKPRAYYHGDGGHAENLAIMPLLARRVYPTMSANCLESTLTNTEIGMHVVSFQINSLPKLNWHWPNAKTAALPA